MGYYQAGDYYGAGDYYAAGGLFDVLGKVVKGVASVGRKVIGGAIGATPVGAAATAVTRAILPSGPAAPQLPTIPAPGAYSATTPYLGLPVTGAGQPQRGNFMMGGKWWHYNKDGELKKGKRPTMNVGNTRALRRADRRIDRFVGVARSALKHTNYKVVSRGAGRGGSRGVITRSEAARALRR